MKKNNKGNFLFLILCVVGYFIIAAPAQKSYTKSKMIEKDIFPLDLTLDVDNLEKTWNWNLEVSFGPVEEQQDLNVDMSFWAKFRTKMSRDQDDFQVQVHLEDSDLSMTFEDNQTTEPVDALALARMFGYPIDSTLDTIQGYLGTMLIDDKGAILTFDIAEDNQEFSQEDLYWQDYREQIEKSRYDMLGSGVGNVIPWIFGYIPLGSIDSGYKKEWSSKNIFDVMDFYYNEDYVSENKPTEDEYSEMKNFLEALIPEAKVSQELLGVRNGNLVFAINADSYVSLEDSCLAMETLMEIELNGVDAELGNDCSLLDMSVSMKGEGEMVIDSKTGMLVSRSMNLGFYLEGYLPAEMSPAGVEMKLDFPLVISEELN
tara:strand:- start:4052 stop:5170 length:1119 start_codon:yes stop_codon:yes gene_type:complete